MPIRKSIILLFISCSVFVADANETEAEKTDDKPKTVIIPVEVVAKEEFDEDVRNIPPLVEKIRTERLAAKNPYIILPHRPNYFLPYTYYRYPSNQELNDSLSHYAEEPVEVDEGYDHPEGVFQISVKYLILEDFWGKLSRIEFGYTNRSYWQLYNQGMSRPFRETNHEPELMFSWPLKDRTIDLVSLSLNHQSNGQTSTLSRSWNRIIFQATSIMDRNILSLKAWYRIPEKDSADPDDPSDDDNPDILEYMGYGEFSYIKLMNQHQFEVILRNNLDFGNNRGAIQLGYTFPFNDRVKGYALYFNGYGDSLIDYNHYQERIGIGIKLSDWF